MRNQQKYNVLYRDRAEVDWTALDHLHMTALWEGLLTSAGVCDLTGVVCITPYYISTPQCLELAYPAERSRKRERERDRLCTVAIKLT